MPTKDWRDCRLSNSINQSNLKSLNKMDQTADPGPSEDSAVIKNVPHAKKRKLPAMYGSISARKMLKDPKNQKQSATPARPDFQERAPVAMKAFPKLKPIIQAIGACGQQRCDESNCLVIFRKENLRFIVWNDSSS